MGIFKLTYVTVYCDRQVHAPHLEFSFDDIPTKAQINAQILAAGWRVDSIGRVTCAEHRRTPGG